MEMRWMRREKENGVMVQKRRTGRRYEEVSKKMRQEEVWIRKRTKEERRSFKWGKMEVRGGTEKKG